MLAMLGWNPGDDREMFTMEELIAAFSLDKVQKAGAKFNPEKAHWYNREYLRLKTDEELTDLLVPILEEHGMNVVDCPKCALTAGADFNVAGADMQKHIFTKEYINGVIAFTKERATFVKDFWDIAHYLFVAPEEFTQKDVDKFWKPEIAEKIGSLASFIKEYDETWSVEALEAALEEFIKGNEWPMGKVMNALRLTLAGSASGLGIADIIARIGKAETLRRIAFAEEKLN